MKQITLNRYSFEELEDSAKDRAINEYIEFLIKTTNFEKLDEENPYYKAYKKSEDLKTPWFIGTFIWEYCEEDILEELKEMGEVFNIKGSYEANI